MEVNKKIIEEQMKLAELEYKKRMKRAFILIKVIILVNILAITISIFSLIAKWSKWLLRQLKEMMLLQEKYKISYCNL